jgi:hypothetical protein
VLRDGIGSGLVSITVKSPAEYCQTEDHGTVTGTVQTLSNCRCKPASQAQPPGAPPESGGCPTIVNAHKDIRHPSLGPVRIFLLWNASTDGLADGCIVAVAANGTVIRPIPVAAYADSPQQANFAFATRRLIRLATRS